MIIGNIYIYSLESFKLLSIFYQTNFKPVLLVQINYYSLTLCTSRMPSVTEMVLQRLLTVAWDC